MGRAKLPIKYREQLRARRSTYTTRWKGMKKKTEEISLLCGVPALVAARSPEFNTVEFWPEKDTPEFKRIRERYLCLHRKRNNSHDKGDEGSGNSADQMPCLPMSSSCVSTTLFHEEMVAMEIKLKEIRERLQFFQADSHTQNLARHFPVEEEQHLAPYTVSTPLQQDHLSYDQLPPDFATFTMLLQQDDLPMINLEQISPPAPPLPPHDQPILPFADFDVPFQNDILYPFEQPTTFVEQLTPFDESHYDLADFNIKDPSSGMLLSESPLWSNADDWAWADSVFLDLESVL